MAIDQISVFSAAEKIFNSGMEPTIDLIRKELGSGSFTTISKYLKSWRDSKSTKTPVIKPPDSVTFSFNNFWELCYREAEKSFHSQKEALENENKKTRDELDQALGEIEKLEISIKSSESKYTSLQVLLEKTQHQKDELHASISKINEELLKAKTQSAHLQDQLKSEIEARKELEKELIGIAKGKK